MAMQTPAQIPVERPRRSVLYVPASNARAVEKAMGLTCDAVLLDLEDAVAPEAKIEARAAAAAFVRARGFGERELLVRCNALDTPWGADDLDAMAQARPDGIVLPKVSDPGAVIEADGRLKAGGADLPIWAMIETTQAVMNLNAIAGAAASTRLEALVLGPNDLSLDMRTPLTTGREALLTALSLMVMAGRAHGLALLDGPFGDLQNTAGLEAQCRQGAMLGFDGKTLIHPSQVEAANRAFSPSAERIAWADKVIAAFAAQPDAGVLKVDGRMAERLHLREAQRIAALALRM
jgi:citrate lyase subunit beta/citryl-CoA lyase